MNLARVALALVAVCAIASAAVPPSQCFIPIPCKVRDDIWTDRLPGGPLRTFRCLPTTALMVDESAIWARPVGTPGSFEQGPIGNGCGIKQEWRLVADPNNPNGGGTYQWDTIGTCGDEIPGRPCFQI